MRKLESKSFVEGMRGYMKVWEDMGRYGKTWEDMGRYEKMPVLGLVGKAGKRASGRLDLAIPSRLRKEKS